MRKLLSVFITAILACGLLGADAANDLILSQRKPDNSGNIQRNVPAQNAITSASLPSFQSSIGIGTEDTLALTGLTLSGQLTSTLATGTAPFVVASTTQVANLNAATAGTATSATTATNATNIGIVDDTSTNATMYPTWVTAATGNLPQKVSSTKLTFNPSTGALATTGPLSAGAISGTTGTFSGVLNTGMTGGSYGLNIRAGAGLATVSLQDSSNSNKEWRVASQDSGAFKVIESGVAEQMVISAGGSTRFAGGLNNTVIGATTPAAGSFTTLAASSTVTQTANNTYYRFTRTANTNYLGLDWMTGSTEEWFMGQRNVGDSTLYVYDVVNATNRAAFTTTGLTVTGTLTTSGVNTLSNLAGTGSRAVLADATGILTAPVSDEHLKEPLIPLSEDYGLPMVMRLQPSRFKYLDKKAHGDQYYLGFGARYTSTILPEVTGQMKDGTYYLSKEDIIPVVVKAVQQQQAQIEGLVPVSKPDWLARGMALGALVVSIAAYRRKVA